MLFEINFMGFLVKHNFENYCFDMKKIYLKKNAYEFYQN